MDNEHLINGFKHRIDNNIGKLLENFGGLLNASKISEETSIVCESFQTSVYATSIVQASESLVKLCAELRLTLAFNDFEKLNAQKSEKSKNIQDRYVHFLAFIYFIVKNSCASLDGERENLLSSVNYALYELEGHYYQSRWREL